jgi:GMP synthase (glutamine-hydrolysing)
MKPPTILALQHAAVELPSRAGDVIVGAGAELQVVATHAGQPVPVSIGDHAGLLVMGGPMGVYEADRHPHLHAERALIEDALSRGVPVLGVCLGSQLLASVLGAHVRPGPRKEIGWYDVSLSPAAKADPLFGAAPRAFTALHWHGDIFDLPPGAVGLARSELTEHQAFSFGESAWGILFHLEVSSRQLDDMTSAFADELAQAGVSRDQIAAGWPTHGPSLEALGDLVFRRWMDVVLARASL